MTQFMRTAYIVFLYALGVLCLMLYVYMDTSKDLEEFLRKADRSGTNRGLAFYASVGFIKLALITAGVALPTVLTAKLIRERGKNV